MPRLFDNNNQPRDYCDMCWPSEASYKVDFGEENNGYDTAHPDYDSDFYYCFECETELKQHLDN